MATQDIELRLTNVFHKNVKAYTSGYRYIINQGGSSCFHGEQLVITSEGEKPIKDIQVGQYALSYNESTNRNEYRAVTDVMQFQNKKPCLEVCLSNGQVIKATEDHRFYYEGGWHPLKYIVSLWYERDMERDSEFQPLPSIEHGEAEVDELQENWQGSGFKACKDSRWLHEDDAVVRRWGVLQLGCSQICRAGVSWFNSIGYGDRSFGLRQNKQSARKFRDCNKEHKCSKGLLQWFNNPKARLCQWKLKADGATSFGDKETCKEWWPILWAKNACAKIWNIGGACKGYCEQKKGCVARCISLADIVSVRSISIDVVYDITVENNHNFYLSTGYLAHNSSKTFSTLQMLCRIAMIKKKQIDIVGLTVPHLKAGVLNDMPAVMAGYGLVFDELFNTSDKKLKFPSGGVINFLAIDRVGKAHGGRRDILYINEANHIKYPIAEQLMIRTRETVFIDYNPTAPFWVHNKTLKEEKAKSTLIRSTYKDNQFLESHIIETIESKKGDGNNNFWRVYGLGELGISEGLVFDNFEKSKFDKEQFENYRHGVDWGFSQDPFAYVRCAIQNNCLYICDEIYQKKLLNKESAPMVLDIAKGDIVTCDSAEPKSVAEFRSLGVNAHSAKKGQGSIETGIKFIQSFDKIYIHEDCPNIYDEFSNYQWKEDKDGESLPVPIDEFNHAIDAIRYALEQDQNHMRTQLTGMRPF